jgi:hypothetical protein
MAMSKKEEEEEIEVDLKKRIKELDRVIKALEEKKEREKKKEKNPENIDADVWVALLKSIRDEGATLSILKERTEAIPVINNKLTSIDERTKTISINITGINNFISRINNKLIYIVAILTVLASLVIGIMVKFFVL